MKYIIGIDEAGRGPLAGPVAVGAVRVASDFDPAHVTGAKDSKQMTLRARERLYEQLCMLRTSGMLDFAVAFSDAAMIDRDGILSAIRAALSNALMSMHLNPDECDVRLDGSLRAPAQFKRQTTIIRGDETELAISLASVAAKVERDAMMRELAQTYPAYGLEIHKGYGTAMHRRMIKERGLSPIHRASFCTRISADIASQTRNAQASSLSPSFV